MSNSCLFSNRPHIQKGLTLIEMMVALTLGLFVIASILQIYASTKQAYRLAEQNSRLQENGRFAMDFLNRYIRMAGYRANTMIPQNVAFPVNNNFAVAGQVIVGSDNSITFRYQGNNDGQPSYSVIDCLGRSVQNNQLVTNIFLLSANDPVNGRSLSCRSIIDSDDWTQPLVPGIEDMQILYGVAPDNNINTQSYMNAAAVQNANRWNNVVSIKIALLLRSDDDNITIQPQTYRYPPWNTVDTIALDLHLRRVFTTTINLRNLTIGY